MADLDLAELRRLAEAATPGPWAWTGHDDGSVELTTKYRGQRRVVSAMRARPCVVSLADGDPGLTLDACEDCRRRWAKWELIDWWNERRARRKLPEWGDPAEAWDGYRCSRPENLATLWLSDPASKFTIVRPANTWSVRQRDYRSDVARVDHPDAAYLAAASPDVLVAVLDRLEAAEVWDYGARVGLHNDLSYAEGTVVGYDLHRRRYKVEVDGYGRTEWVPRSQLRPLPPSSVAVPGAVAGEPESTPAAEEVACPAIGFDRCALPAGHDGDHLPAGSAPESEGGVRDV